MRPLALGFGNPFHERLTVVLRAVVPNSVICWDIVHRSDGCNYMRTTFNGPHRERDFPHVCLAVLAEREGFPKAADDLRRQEAWDLQGHQQGR